ncbi:MAG: HAMP domain-containing protein [Acidipila sp.]|nr:HAMP domain-containing protein [Acidipila sp.]
MSLRTKLLGAFVLTVLLVVSAVAWGTSTMVGRALEEADREGTQALLAEFRGEFARRGADIAQRLEGIAGADATLRMAIDLSGTAPDLSQYVNTARDLAVAHQLDLLEIISADGTIVSSAQWPARFGYKKTWVIASEDWSKLPAFLEREELAPGATLALLAVRMVNVSGSKIFIVGGQKLDREFLTSLTLPSGMRALLYRNLEPGFSSPSLIEASGRVAQGDRLAPLIGRMRIEPGEKEQTVHWSANSADAETFYAMPLFGRQHDLMGVLLVGSSRRRLVMLQSRIRWLGLGVGLAGVLLGMGLALETSKRVTRPVVALAAGARAVAAGDWSARVPVTSHDEIGELAEAFNQMTQELMEQRERLVQVERVAAWRELARRLAHELKNPLFPLQITVENLERARAQSPEQFDEVFRESTATLLTELRNMQTIIGRFSDFARMPPPELEAVNVNQVLQEAARLVAPQMQMPGRPGITLRLELGREPALEGVPADAILLHRAFENLILNSLDAMPEGGALTIRTSIHGTHARMEFTDTGVGVTAEERERLFTPYYTTKQHGTGLGLAVVQSVVSDHGGTITVESDPGRQTTFRVELPLAASGSPLAPRLRAETERAG